MTLEQLKQMVENQKLIKEKELDFQKRVNEIKNQSYSNSNALTNQIPAGWQQTFDPSMHLPLPHVHPNPTYIDYEQLKKTRIPSRQDYKDGYNVEGGFWQSLKNEKSPTQALLDDLFTEDEKVEYLISMGYRKLENSSYLVKGEPDPEFKRTFTIDEAFFIELRVKLKNILLAKQSLKFKI